MAVLDFDATLDRWKHRILSFCGETELRDHLIRGGIMSYKDFKLTSTQMDTLNATPVTLIAAPGAGKALVVEGVYTFIDAGSTAFELGSGTLDFKYTNGSGAQVATSVPNAQVESSSDTQYRSVALAVVPVLNAVVVAHASADVTAGNGTIYGRVWYRIVDNTELDNA